MLDFATVNGYRLRHRVAGEGPLGIFGHGLLGSIEQLEDYADALRALEGRSRLVTYDARGHGQSEGPEAIEGYSWESLGRDMSALAACFDDKPAVFGGASMGAASALWVALEQPERCRGLVLVMPPPLGGPAHQSPEERQAIQVLETLSAAVRNFGLATTIELARKLPGFADTPEAADERARWLGDLDPRSIAYAAAGLIQSPFHDPEDYRRITVPTLVMAHEGDGLHPARAARLLGETIAGSVVHIAPSPGYWKEHPQEFVAEVFAFMDRLA